MMLTNKELFRFFRIYEIFYLFFKSNNFTISFKFVDIDLSSLFHVDVICLNFLHLKQRFDLKRINAFLLINRKAAFDEKLNKFDLFSKKIFRENEIDIKIFEKKNV